MRKCSSNWRLFAFLACAATTWAGKEFPAGPGERVVPNELLIRFLPGVAPSGVLQRYTSLPFIQPLGGQDIYRVAFPNGAPPGIAAQIASDAAVIFVEPNRVRTSLLAAPNDPNYASQWALQTVQALQAWNLLPDQYLTAATASTSRLKVAILDTGADCTHPDFINTGGSSPDAASGGQLVFSQSQAPVATTIPSPVCPWQDDEGHGTHVTGIVAAATSNATGVSGLGYPLQIIEYKILDSGGQGADGPIASAIMSATDAGARVISMSLGGSGYSQAMQVAINYAWQHNVLVVSAAGNSSSSSLFFPADANHGVAVSATDSSNNLASFSNFGPYISLAAPGVGILSTAPTYPVTSGWNNYVTLSGTSMATPFVSALAGLTAMTTPNTTAEAVLRQMQQTASTSTAGGGWNQNFGYGLINAFNTISNAKRAATNGGVFGQIIDTSANPVFGANITINSQTITTDASGLFHFGTLAAGVYNVSVSAAGFTSLALSVTVAPGADTPFTATMGQTYGRLTGTVTDQGQGVAGAVVHALSGGLISATAVTSSTGAYTLWVKGGATYDVQASAIYRTTTTVTGFTVANGANVTANLTLPGFGTIAGTVVDSASHPVNGAQVLVTATGFSAAATTNASGSYSLVGLPSGTYSATASASGLTPATQNNLAVAADATTTANFTLGGVFGNPWYNASWTNRKAVTIDHTKVSGSASLSNFALLFQVTDANLKIVSNGGNVGKIDGTDILFTASDGITKLDHELEAYSPTTGQITAWVRIPSLSNSADTGIYIYYGNAAAADQQNKTGVWDASYTAVWHLPNGSTLSAADSTSNGNAGTINGAAAGTGLMGGGGSFNGTVSYVAIPSPAFPSVPTSGSTSAYTATFSAWFKTGATGVILGQDSGAQPPSAPGGYVPAIYIDTAGHLRSSMFWHGSGSLQESSSGMYNDGAWHHLTVTFNNGTETLYVDGAAAGSQTGLTESGYNGTYKYFLGTGYSSSWPSAAANWWYFNGFMDEMRVSSNARSSDWVLTEFRNQNAPSTFLSEGAQEGSGSGQPQVQAPVFSPPGGTYSSGQSVTITSATPGASIRYTTDGSTPTSSTGTVYSAPVAVNSTLTLKAIAYAASMTDSNVTSALYTINTGGGSWYNASWSNRKTVTIDHTKVSGGASLANFALLFQATDANLKTVSNGGGVGKIDGTDILFTASDGITKLDHELEAYTPTTGQITAWVRIPSLSNSADTVIYIYYGNAAAADQQNKTGVWDANYKAVWHLPNGSTLSAADSTSNANGGTISGATAGTGLMAGGASFNGSSGNVTIPSAAFGGFPASGNISAYSATFSAWFKTSATGVILGQDSGEQPPTSPGGYVPAVYIDTSGHLRSSLFWHGSGALQEVSSGIYNDGGWHYLSVTFNNGTETLYVDGSLAGSQTGLTENAYNGTYKYFLGTMYSSFWPSAASNWWYFNGLMDEMRVSSAARSSDWVLTEFRNQNIPSTFFSEGAQQTNGQPQVQAPVFSPPGGTYSTVQSVTITSATQGASIRYTTDGSTPTSTIGTLYQGPVAVNSTLTLKAIAFAASMTDSTVTSALYTISGTVAWYNTSWAHRKTVTIDHTKVSGSASLANFALLFQATDANLKTISNGGSVGKIDGTDILFTASDGVTKLDHELEAYTPTTGQVTAWVRIPALSNSADTVVYIYYGNAAAPDQQNKTGVWDTNYKAVWHLPNGSTLSAADSTSNANGGTISGATAGTGLMAGGASFNGSSGNVTIPSAAFTGFPTSGNISAYSATFSAWFKTSAAGVILGQDSGEPPPTSPGGYVPAVYIDSTGHLRSSLFWHGSGSLQETSSGIYNDGAWHHVTVTFNNGTEALYVDGTLAGSQTGLTENGYNASYKYFLGTMYSSFWPSAAFGWSYFNGIMDEMRVSNAARSSDWVLTEYRNQNAPATFFSEGPQQ